MNAAMLLSLTERLDGLDYHVAETRRMISNMIRPGVVKSFDAENNTAVLDVGFETHDVPLGNHGGTAKHWHPLKKGQQVTLFCPDGDPSNGFVLPGGFHDDNKAPSQSADEDIPAQRGADDKPVRFRLTDELAELDNRKNKTRVRAGEDSAELVHTKNKTAVRAKEKVAELDNPDGKTAVRAKEGGVVVAEVTDIAKFNIVVNGQAFSINPQALLPA
jgi:phage baseplate assembly protein V